MKDFLKGKKTYILGGLMFLHGLVSWLVGDMTFQQMLAGSQELAQMFGGGLIASTRAATANNQ